MEQRHRTHPIDHGDEQTHDCPPSDHECLDEDGSIVLTGVAVVMGAILLCFFACLLSYYINKRLENERQDRARLDSFETHANNEGPIISRQQKILRTTIKNIIKTAIAEARRIQQREYQYYASFAPGANEKSSSTDTDQLSFAKSNPDSPAYVINIDSNPVGDFVGEMFASRRG